MVCLFGVGDVFVWGVGEYVMCVWLDLVKIVNCGFIVSDIVMVLWE